MTANQEPYELPPEDSALVELDKQVGKDRKASRWMTWALLGLLLITCGLAVLVYVFASDARDNAEALAAEQAQEKQVIAQEAREVICLADDVEVYDKDLCERLDAAASGEVRAGKDGKDGKDGAPGPRGTPGLDGKDGEPGPAGSPGPTGAAGRDGVNGATVNGKDGETGPAGPAGPVGPTGPAGPIGPAGASGAPGRGMIGGNCVGTGESSYWLLEYSDGTSQTVPGPCRINLASPNPEPLPSTSIRP